MREAESEVLLCEHKKNPETDGYEREKSLKSAKTKRNEITITETRKKLKRKENRKQVQI